MLRNFSLALVTLLALSGSGIAAQAALLNINANGQLIGARDIDLGSLGLFDVQFEEGTCTGIFSGCENADDDFTFQAERVALDAAQALLDQIFTGGPTNIFDTRPDLTFGCEASLCNIFVPYGVRFGQVELAVAVNDNSADRTFTGNVFSTQDTGSELNSVYARFTTASSSTAVPEPGVLGLLGVGLIGLAFARRRKRNAS